LKITAFDIPDIFLLEPSVFNDSRGFFMESFNQKKFSDLIGKNISFVQDNHSMSHKGVLRGLHFQLPPNEQGKLVRVVKGKIFDVAVDIRKGSKSFGKYVSQFLSETNKNQLWIPDGFAHGFLTLEDDTHVLYKATSYYQPSSERSIRYDDEEISIDWPEMKRIVSNKDLMGISLKDISANL
jgi:dTDP-4-dehydrorhamnose 3,5-epimerase